MIKSDYKKHSFTEKELMDAYKLCKYEKCNIYYNDKNLTSKYDENCFLVFKYTNLLFDCEFFKRTVLFKISRYNESILNDTVFNISHLKKGVCKCTDLDINDFYNDILKLKYSFKEYQEIFNFYININFLDLIKIAHSRREVNSKLNLILTNTNNNIYLSKNIYKECFEYGLNVTLINLFKNKDDLYEFYIENFLITDYCKNQLILDYLKKYGDNNIINYINKLLKKSSYILEDSEDLDKIILLIIALHNNYTGINHLGLKKFNINFNILNNNKFLINQSRLHNLMKYINRVYVYNINDYRNALRYLNKNYIYKLRIKLK